MLEFRFPVPGSYLRKHVDALALIEDYVFSDQDAVIDLMLALDREKRDAKRHKLKPASYYAKRWKWGRTTTYDNFPRLCEMVQKWRDLSPDANRTVNGRKPDAKPAIEPVMDVLPDALRTLTGRLTDGIEQTQTTNTNITTNELKQTNPQKAARFKKPGVESVLEYLEKYTTEKKIVCDISERAETFWDFYESKGWKVGKNPMKDWRAAVRNFLRSAKRENGKQTRSIERTYDGQNDPEFKQFYAT